MESSYIYPRLHYNKHRRINKLDIPINTAKDVSKDEYIVIAIDSTGIKVTNRGQWMRDKWHIKNNKKGYLKIHVAVNVKTKKILAMKVTDEHVHDIKALPGLVKDVIKSDNITPITIGKLFADGGASMMVMIFLDVLKTME